jgi:hypothetical protein
MEASITEAANESIWVEVLILSGIESARQEHSLDYVIARTFVSFAGEPSGIPVGRRCVAAILCDHPDETIGGIYNMAFLQKYAW